MNNPYFDLHKEFSDAGAEVLISSGQACVLMGIAAFSKDGDWIIRERSADCERALNVLARHGAVYRLGAPLDPKWLREGWTSHFEYRGSSGIRLRVDFCSRPPRIEDLEALWDNAVAIEDFRVVDAASLARIKQTRRMRDYPIIGAIADVAGYAEGNAEMALTFLQDFDLLSQAVTQWPEEAAASRREAVQVLVSGATRGDVVTALALEQDKYVQKDQERINGMRARTKPFERVFSRLRSGWRSDQTNLHEQHSRLLQEGRVLLEDHDAPE